MEVQITGKGLNLGAALQTHVEERISGSVHKYFERPAEAQVTFDKEGSGIRCEAVAHLASGVYLAAEGNAQDAYGAFDEAVEKLEKRVRRHKRRLKDHHAKGKDPLPALNASSYVLKAFDETEDEEAEEFAPVVIAERSTNLREMTVSDAALQLDLADEPIVLFKNAAHGRLNVVYKRADGNIGWVDADGK